MGFPQVRCLSLGYAVNHCQCTQRQALRSRARILVQVTINRRLLIGRDGHLDQSEAYDLS